MAVFQIFLATTGTLSPVTIEDLGAIEFVHPTTGFELVGPGGQYSAEAVVQSEDLQAEVDAGTITLTDQNGETITVIAEAVLTLSGLADVDFPTPPADGEFLSFDNGSGNWTSEAGNFVKIPGDTMTGDLIMDNAELRVRNSGGTIDLVIGYDTDGTNAPEIRRSDGGATLTFLTNATQPQLIFGSDAAGTTDLFIDCDNNGILHLNEFHSGPVKIGQGGLRLEESQGGPEYIAIKANNSMTSNYEVFMPADQGGVGTALVNDGSGNLSWTTVQTGGGASIPLEWKFDQLVTSGNPGTGFFRLNNSNPALATQIFINEEDENGLDASTLLAALTANDNIYIQQIEDGSRFVLVNITGTTDNGSWYTLDITVSDSGTIFEDGKECRVVLLYNTIGDISPGGLDSHIQYNNNGSFGGESNFVYDDTLKRVTVLGIDATPELVVGGTTQIDSSATDATVYIEVPSTGAQVEGLRTYFNRQSAGINGWISYDYDGNNPRICVVDEDDDPPYILFSTIGTGTDAAPEFANRFGSRGPVASVTTGFSWYVNGTEIANSDTTFHNLIDGSAQYQMAGIPIPLKKYDFFADQVDFAFGTNWAVNNGAPASRDTNNNALIVRRFDDTTEEAIGVKVVVPVQAVEMIIRTKARAETAPGSAQVAVPKLYKRTIPDNGAVSSWTSNTLTNINIPTNENFQYDETTNTLAGWGLTAGEAYQFQLSRDAGNGSDNLSGDLSLLVWEVEFR